MTRCTRWLRTLLQITSTLWTLRGNSLQFHGFLDALRGSHSERALRQTPYPLLAIPVQAAVVPKLCASQA